MGNLINDLHGIAEELSAEEYSEDAEIVRDAVEEIERLRGVIAATARIGGPTVPDDSAAVVGIPVLARHGRDKWCALGEDGTRFNLVLAPSP